jgi:hypothetical protein
MGKEIQREIYKRLNTFEDQQLAPTVGQVTPCGLLRIQNLDHWEMESVKQKKKRL